MAKHHAPSIAPGYPLELPNALRASAPFAALALLSLLLLPVPDVPVWTAAVAAAAFALAAVLRAAQQHHALSQLRSNLDSVLLREATRMSPMLAWRTGELCAPTEREYLAASLRRLARSVDESHLAGATPPNRTAVRANAEEIEAIIARLSSFEPVSAGGMILLKRLLDDPAELLYDSDLADELRPQLDGARRALDDHLRSHYPAHVS